MLYIILVRYTRKDIKHANQPKKMGEKCTWRMEKRRGEEGEVKEEKRSQKEGGKAGEGRWAVAKRRWKGEKRKGEGLG